MHMKKILALITLIISISSCDKPSPNDDSYYVQYNAQIHTMYYGDIVDISMNGPSRYLGGNKTFSVTYGPVKKGFNAWISATCTAYSGSAECSIWVSKNNEPFAQKATARGNRTATASYKIDY